MFVVARQTRPETHEGEGELDRLFCQDASESFRHARGVEQIKRNKLVTLRIEEGLIGLSQHFERIALAGTAQK